MPVEYNIDVVKGDFDTTDGLHREQTAMQRRARAWRTWQGQIVPNKPRIVDPE
jgi:hypothetical protein